MIYRIEPVSDPRWNELVVRHPLGSVFHSAEWLRALQRTYGYEPVALTTSGGGQSLENGLVYCKIASLLTGRRLVSLPFSDHCDILTAAPVEEDFLLMGLSEELQKTGGKYAEVRSRNFAGGNGFREAEAFCFHALDLSPSAEQLFGNFHKDCIQRKIRRAQRDQLSIEQGRSNAMVESFYRLLGMTRRRHGYPAPPLTWFKNLVEGFGERLTIRVAAKSGMAVAAILSLTFKDAVIYKYGGSDADHHCSGAMPMLFWSLIQDAKAAGIRTLDLGRSDLDNPGLIAFKNRWGARQSQIVYRRFPLEKPRGSVAGWGLRTAKQMFARMPDSLSRATGKLLYRHVG